MTCDRCRRSVRPWMLRRGDHCSPSDWAVCIRQFADVAKTTAAKAARKEHHR